jgi:very-short-patch-repair endonuclease
MTRGQRTERTGLPHPMSAGEALLLFQIRAMKLPEGVPEHVFARPREWRFDRAWPDRKLAIEVEGGTWVGGRHTRGAGFEADCIKYTEAAVAGWRVLRVTTSMVKTGVAIDALKRALTQ